MAADKILVVFVIYVVIPVIGFVVGPLVDVVVVSILVEDNTTNVTITPIVMIPTKIPAIMTFGEVNFFPVNRHSYVKNKMNSKNSNVFVQKGNF